MTLTLSFGADILSGPQKARMSMVGTPYWMSPEMIMQSPHHEKESDIWSVGATLYEMFTGKPPWLEIEASNPFALMFAIATHQDPPTLPPDVSVSDAAKDFMNKCFQR